MWSYVQQNFIKLISRNVIQQSVMIFIFITHIG